MSARTSRGMVIGSGSRVFPAVTKETLLAHIHVRLGCLHHEGGEPTSGADWLSDHGEPVDLVAYGVNEEPREFDFAAWCQAPNAAFAGRTPKQVIDYGTEADRDQLADAVGAIAALLDGAFS